MSPEQAARHITPGWRVVAAIPRDDADVTYEHIAPLFSGDRAALRDIARLAQAAPIAVHSSDGDERLAASAPRRPTERQTQRSTEGSAYEQRRKVG